MISEEQFKVIENYFGNEVSKNLSISIHTTEYVVLDAEEKELFPGDDDYYGVISFMSEDDNPEFIKNIYILIAEFAIQYEMCNIEIESREGYVDVVFLDLL